MRISDWSSDVWSSDLVYVAGATGILTNGGGIAGTVVLGQSIDNHSQTQIDTVTTTTQTVTPAEALTAQTYTFDQNNFLGGGVSVGDATITTPLGRDEDRKSVGSGKRVHVCLDPDVCRIINKQKKYDKRTQ